MKSANDYINQIQTLGLGNISMQADTISEAKEAIKLARQNQTQLRAIKRDINLDMKAIRAHYTDESNNAAATSSTVYEILGNRKAAGRVRADAKRKLRSERDQVLQPYENVKYTIDDLLAQYDSAKELFQNLINEHKAEEEAARLADEEKLESLRTIHLTTSHFSKTIPIKPKNFSTPRPVAPPNKFSFPAEMPSVPIHREAGVRGRFSRKHREQVALDNQAAQKEHEQKLADWEIDKQKAEESFDKNHENHQRELENWNQEKAEFEESERLRVQNLEEARLSDQSTMELFVSKYVCALGFLAKQPFECKVSADSKTTSYDVELPNINDWPVKQKSTAQMRRDYLAHIHSISFRVIGETFVALPGIKQVIYSGYVWIPNKQTGQLQKAYLISTKVWRSAWEQLNFDRLDWINVYDCFDGFETRRNFTKTALIRYIEPFEVT